MEKKNTKSLYIRFKKSFFELNNLFCVINFRLETKYNVKSSLFHIKKNQFAYYYYLRKRSLRNAFMNTTIYIHFKPVCVIFNRRYRDFVETYTLDCFRWHYCTSHYSVSLSMKWYCKSRLYFTFLIVYRTATSASTEVSTEQIVTKDQQGG